MGRYQTIERETYFLPHKMSKIVRIVEEFNQQSGSMRKVTVRVAACAVRNETSNPDISRHAKNLLESHFGGKWTVLVGTDFSTVLTGDEAVDGTLAHYAITRE